MSGVAEKMKVVTHSGQFHADDVFAFAVLQTALGDIDLVRSRDAHVIAEADLVFDVGGVYDVDRRRYDHHMRDLPRRPDGIPYSSVGLIWRDFGRAALPGLVPGIGDEAIGAVWQTVDEELILLIDQADNGIGPAGPGHLALLIEAFNPAWDSQQTYDEAFREAAETAWGILSRACRQALASERAAAMVLAAAKQAPDRRIIVLDRKLPWEKAVYEGNLNEALFIIYPSEDRSAWYCRAIPPEPSSFGQRLSLPEAWRGLQDRAFSEAAAITDGVFCHPSGFICGARSRESAIGLAAQAIALAQS